MHVWWTTGYVSEMNYRLCLCRTPLLELFGSKLLSWSGNKWSVKSSSNSTEYINFNSINSLYKKEGWRVDHPLCDCHYTSVIIGMVYVHHFNFHNLVAVHQQRNQSNVRTISSGVIMPHHYQTPLALRLVLFDNITPQLQINSLHWLVSQLSG